MALLEWLKVLIFGAPKAVPGLSPFAPGTGPARIVVLRHAEKTGDRIDRGLSSAGSERAARIVRYIPDTFGSPDVLIAAKSSDRSRRPVETLEPLAAALSLDIKAKYDDKETDALVSALGGKPSFRGKFCIICWRHSDIPRLVAALGAPVGIVPDRWDETDYTTLVEIDYPGGTMVTGKRLKMPF